MQVKESFEAESFSYLFFRNITLENQRKTCGKIIEIPKISRAFNH